MKGGYVLVVVEIKDWEIGLTLVMNIHDDV